MGCLDASVPAASRLNIFCRFFNFGSYRTVSWGTDLVLIDTQTNSGTCAEAQISPPARAQGLRRCSLFALLGLWVSYSPEYLGAKFNHQVRCTSRKGVYS